MGLTNIPIVSEISKGSINSNQYIWSYWPLTLSMNNVGIDLSYLMQFLSKVFYYNTPQQNIKDDSFKA